MQRRTNTTECDKVPERHVEKREYCVRHRQSRMLSTMTDSAKKRLGIRPTSTRRPGHGHGDLSGQRDLEYVLLFVQTVVAMRTGRGTGELGIPNTQVRKLVDGIRQDRDLMEAIVAQVSSRINVKPLARKEETTYQQVLALIRERWPKQMRRVCGLYLSPRIKGALEGLRIALAFVCPPVALLLAGRPLQAAVNGAVLGLSVLGVTRHFASWGPFALAGFMVCLTHALIAGIET